MNETIIKFNNEEYKFFIRDEADQSVMREIFKLREYKATEEKIKTSKIVVDVGAHVGFFSIYTRALNAKAKIFAIEPVLSNIEQLTRHLKVNKITGVQVAEIALARKTGARQMETSVTDSHNHRLAEKGNLKVVAMSFKDFCEKNKIKQIDVLKMDIEGGEYEVFAGMDMEDFSKIKTVILEYHTAGGFKREDLEVTLRENGFGVQIFPSKFDKTMGFLFAINKRCI